MGLLNVNFYNYQMQFNLHHIFLAKKQKGSLNEHIQLEVLH